MAIEKSVLVPDIGGATDVAVIEVLVVTGQKVALEESLVTLESDKASMDVPAPFAGVVKTINIHVGDKVSQGSALLILELTNDTGADEAIQEVQTAPVVAATTFVQADKTEQGEAHAGPAVRQLARELGVSLSLLKGTGPKGRIIKDDLKLYVKNILQGGGHVIPAAIADIDFSQWGEVITQPLSKIKKLSGAYLQRNWMQIPHVTQFDEADITDLEAFRHTQKEEAEKQGYKLTPLAFIIKAVVNSLQEYPHFNASLHSSGEELIIKKYYHIGVAVDTPEGLVVPIVRDADKKSIGEIAKELGEISVRARDKKLKTKELQGSSFTSSSLGGISGTAFTPIINAPDVAILGVSKAAYKPVYEQGIFVPKLLLPLSLSYDHRVIDGADGARFTKHLTAMLADIRRLTL